MKHIYMGEGKGKTTAAVGLAVRCAGSGQKVLFTQFLKPGVSGELDMLQGMDFMQLLLCPVSVDFTWRMSDEDKAALAEAYEQYLWDITRVILQGNFGMLILDEIIGACQKGLVSENYLVECLEQMPVDVEIVLTGRYPSDAFLEMADYVTEMKKVKHPFDVGVKARKGIEFRCLSIWKGVCRKLSMKMGTSNLLSW